MTYASRISRILFFMIVSSSLSDRVTIAMDRVGQQGMQAQRVLDSYGENWPRYVENNLTSRQFFIIKPVVCSPVTMHMRGLFCTGHEGSSFYESFNAYIPALIQSSENAYAQNDPSLAWHYLRCSRLLEAYQDATCSYIAQGDRDASKKIDVLESMIKIFPTIDSSTRTQWHCSGAYSSAVAMLSELAKDNNVRAQVVLANLYAAQAVTNEDCRPLVHKAVQAIFDSKTDSECRDIVLAYDLRKAFLVCSQDYPMLYRLFQVFLYERGSAEEKQKAFEYFEQASSNGDLLAECYHAAGLLAGLKKKRVLSDVLKHLTILSLSEAGRQLLPIFASLCDEKIEQFLITDGCKKDAEYRDAILGLVSYVKGDGIQAFTYLQRCSTQTQPYLYYCLACLCKDGCGTDKNYYNAVMFYLKALHMAPDKELEGEIKQRLNEMGENRYIPLLRLAFDYGLEYVCIDQKTAIEYLDRAVEHNIPVAGAFYAHLYRNGIWVEKSEERALFYCQKELAHQEVSSLEQALSELLALASSDTYIGIMARYLAVIYLIRCSDDQKDLALELFEQAEKLAKTSENYKKLRDFACQPGGSWDTMLSVAQDNDKAAALMGVLYIARLKNEAGNILLLNEIEKVGMPLLERVRGKVDSINNTFVSNAYVILTDAWYNLGIEYNKYKVLLGRAKAIKPDNAEVILRLADYYKDDDMMCGKNAKGYAIKSFKLLTSAAIGLNDPCALMELAMAYLPSGESPYVKHGIIKPSEETAIQYLHEIVGKNFLQIIKRMKKDILSYKVHFLALMLVAKLHMRTNPAYTAQLVPHMKDLFQIYKKNMVQSGEKPSKFDEALRCDWPHFMGLWSIEKKQWDDALIYIKEFDDNAGLSIESLAQQVVCHIEKSKLSLDGELKKKCYHDAMLCLLKVLDLGAIKGGAFVSNPVSMIFEQFCNLLRIVEANNRYAQTILAILKNNLEKAGFVQ